MRSVRTRLLFVGAPLLAAAVAALLVVRFAGGSDGPGDPAEFVTGLVGQIAANDYADAWASWTWILHPERFAEYRAGRCPS